MAKHISFVQTKKFDEIMENMEIRPFKVVDKILQEISDWSVAEINKKISTSRTGITHDEKQ